MKQYLQFRARFTFGLILASATLLCAVQSVSAADLVIHVINKKDVNGIAFIAITPESEADKFPNGKAFFTKTIAMKSNEKTKFTVKDVPPGTYSATGFLDINGNKELDSNIVGAPTEPYGFSRDARGLFGPPSFADAAFVIKKDSTKNRQTIKLH